MDNLKTVYYKRNKVFWTGMVLTIVAIITLICLSFTFAKYTSQGFGGDNSRVAKWGVGVEVKNNLNLFSNAYKNGSVSTYGDKENTVQANSDQSQDHLIAPGTHNSAKVAVIKYNEGEGGYPEVMYNFNIDLKIEDQAKDSQTVSLIEKLDDNDAFTWSLTDFHGNTTQHKTYENLVNAVKALSQKGVAPNSAPKCFDAGSYDNSLIIGWDWSYDDNNKGTYDQRDTELGRLAAAGKLKSLKLSLTVGAVQTQTSGGLLNPQIELDTTQMDLTEDDDSQSRNVYYDLGAKDLISVQSSDESVTTVAFNSGKTKIDVTPKKAGEATITVSSSADEKYSASSVSFNVVVKSSCEHELEHVDATEPTYINKGNKEYYKCAICGKWFWDSAGKMKL